MSNQEMILSSFPIFWIWILRKKNTQPSLRGWLIKRKKIGLNYFLMLVQNITPSNLSMPRYVYVVREHQQKCTGNWNLKMAFELSIVFFSQFGLSGKVWNFWEAHIIWKNPPLWFWRLLSKSADLSKPRGRFFSNFVFFSKSPNFNKIS